MKKPNPLCDAIADCRDLSDEKRCGEEMLSRMSARQVQDATQLQVNHSPHCPPSLVPPPSSYPSPMAAVPLLHPAVTVAAVMS